MKEMEYFLKMARDVAVSNLEAHREGKNIVMEKNMLVWLVTTYGSTILILTTTKTMIKMVHAQNTIKINEHSTCIESI